MNKNSLITKAIAGFLAVLMVFGTLVSLRGFNVQAETVVERESAKTEESVKGASDGHRVVTQQVKFFEWKMKDKNRQNMEIFQTVAGGETYIGLWYDGTESFGDRPSASSGAYTRVWLAQDQYKNPGAFQDITNGKLPEYCDPRDEAFFVQDETNYRGFVWGENYGPNRNWWLKTNTYYNSNSTPWDIIEKIIYVGTEGTPAYNHMVDYFENTIYPKMMTEYTRSAYFGTDVSNGCAIKLSVYDPINGSTTEFIGADVELMQESFGFWYKPTWHNRSTPTDRDKQLYKQYLLPALVQCAIYAITSGNTNVSIPGNGTWPSSHDMNPNQKDPWNNVVARRELTRTMSNGSTAAAGTSSGSYVRMIVNEILNYAKNSVGTVPAANKISYSIPTYEVGRNKIQYNYPDGTINPNGNTHLDIAHNEYGAYVTDEHQLDANGNEVLGPNGEKYGYKGVFIAQPPTEQKINVTFHAEFYTDIAADGSLTGKTNTPHTNAGVQWPRDFTFDVGLTNGGSQVATGHTPVMNGEVVANPTSTGKTWDYTWNDMPKVSKADDYGINISNLNEEWVFLPGKTSYDMDSNGNVTITGRFVYNRTDFTIKKNWKNNITGSTAAPDGASATFQLKQNGKNYGSAQTIDGANNWTYTWTKLPKYVTNGNTNLGGIQWNSSTEAKTYVYSAQETAVSPAEWNIDSNPKTVDGILTFTNTKDNEDNDDQVTITITQTNKWVGMGNQIEWANTSNLYIPTEIGYQLYANGVPYGEPQFFTNPYGGNKTWDDQAVWNNLPKYDENGVEIVYSIGVANPDARWWLDDRIQYTKPSTDTEGVYVDENGNYRFDLTHRWNLTNIFVQKKWTKNGVPTDAPADVEITVKLMRYSADGNHEHMATVVLNKANNWKAQFMTDKFTNTGAMDPFFPRYSYTDNGVEKLAYFLVEEGHDEEVWTPVYPENYGDSEYYNSTNNGTYTWPITNNCKGDYSLDKTAKLTADGTYTVTLTAQYNGYAPDGSEYDLDTYISDTLGDDFHVASGYSKNNVKVYTQKYLGKDANGNDKWGELVALSVNPATVTTSNRNITLGEYGSNEDKLGLNVKVDYDLEKNGCYVDANGNAQGYRVVVEITKVLANGDALGDRLPLGDAHMNNIDEDLNTGICGIYEDDAILKANLNRNGEIIKDAKLIFPKPTVQIREMVQVYDFGLRQRNDDLLDFFGHGSDYNLGMGDVEHVLAVDYMYKDQTRGTDTISYKYTHGNDEFEVGIVTLYTGNGTPGAGWDKKSEYNNMYVWTNTASHPAGNDHSCFGYFEPKAVTANEYVVSALIEIGEGTFAWCRVKFMPATNVYYEAEQFANTVDKTFVNNKNFENETTQDAYAVHDRYQNHSTGDLQHLYGYDDAYINGHEGSEDDLHSHAAYNAYGLSNGNALSVTLTKADYEAISADSSKKWPYVEFSFTGEAFDIIASANATSGFISVQVSKNQNADGTWKFGKNDVIVSKYVDTRYFGAADENVNYDAATGTMTQVPVLRINADKYGDALENRTYGVRISAVYLPDLIPIQPSKGVQTVIIPGLEGEFEVESAFDNSANATKGHTPTNPYPDMKVVFDAIRVFNPKADSVSEHMETETNGAYAGIKDIIRANAVLNPDNYGDDLYTGGIYIDYLHVQNINQQTGENVGEPIIPKDEDGVYTLDQYLRYGPNHEMYLKNGNAFAFVLNNVHERQSLHVAAKVPFKATIDGKNTVVALSGKIYGIDAETNKVGYMKEITPITIDSATPMYYSVTDAIVSDIGNKVYSKNLVILQCTVYELNADGTIKDIAEDTDSILSLTGVKLVNKPDEYGNVTRPNIIGSAKTNSNVKGAESETPAITMYAEAYESAMAIVAGIKGDVDGDGRVTLMDALLTMRCAIGAAELNNYGEICADMDGDNVIDLRDAVAIIRASMV